jgi:hypothetical protein
MTDEERISIHRILGIGVSRESVLLINQEIAEVEAQGHIDRLKELLADPETDRLALSRFISLDLSN